MLEAGAGNKSLISRVDGLWTQDAPGLTPADGGWSSWSPPGAQWWELGDDGLTSDIMHSLSHRDKLSSDAL